MNLVNFDAWYRARYHRTSSALTATVFILADLFGVMVSFGAGFFLVNLYDIHAINFKSFVEYWLYLPAIIVVFYTAHLYPGITMAPAEEFKRFFKASIMSHAGIVLALYIQQAHRFTAIMVAFALSWLCSLVILMFCRSMLRAALARTTWWGIPAVIYGGGKAGKMIVDHLLDKRSLGYRPVLILDDDPATGDEYRGVPVIHDTGIGPTLVERYEIKMAIVAMPTVNRNELALIMDNSVSAFRYNVLIPDFLGMTNIWMSVRDFDGILGLSTSQRLLMPWNREIKRVIDIIAVITGGLVISPILLILSLLVWSTSKGPIFYGHTRLGKNGVPFKAWKFRSMVIDSERRLKEILETDPKAREEWEACHKLQHDPRVTLMGKFLRKTSLDELPQLWNILKGEMALVGPRPIVQDEVPKYGGSFNRVFSVSPGLTGLWQVSGRSDTDYDERVYLDTYYIQSWSLWLDFWILYKTLGVVIHGRGAY